MFLRMVAFGDRKDFLQVLRKLHFRRKCNLRKTCKRDAAEAEPLPARDYCPTLFLSLLPPRATSLSCGSVI